ncbi:diaminopimelate epimerase [Chloroflexota bacterium]
MVVNFSKLQATGNDFILIDARNIKRNWPKLAQDMCHRHFGVGSDGLILLKNSRKADFEMRMLNPDGSEAQVCGNGLRCFAKYVVDNGIITRNRLTVTTLSGIKSIRVYTSQGKVNRVKVNMGTPRFKAEEIPVLAKQKKNSIQVPGYKLITDYPIHINGNDLLISFVSMGNPHTICFSNNKVSDFPLSGIGPEMEHHHIFPERTNFEIVKVINNQTLEARVWERGAGETLACGSGACAIAVTSRIKGYTGDNVDIILPGGKLSISWDGLGDVYLTGNVEEVFRGGWLK